MEIKGCFEVIDSFSIRKRNEFYLIGRIKTGRIEESWLVHVPLNKSMTMSIEVKRIEEVEMTSDQEVYTLLIVDCKDDDEIDFFKGFNLGLENLEISSSERG